MSDNIIKLVQPAGDGVHIDADQILEANNGVWVHLIIAGFDANGELVCAGTDGHRDSIYMLERAKQVLLTQDTERT